jgi:hypothetical protein
MRQYVLLVSVLLLGWNLFRRRRGSRWQPMLAGLVDVTPLGG